MGDLLHQPGELRLPQPLPHPVEGGEIRPAPVLEGLPSRLGERQGIAAPVGGGGGGRHQRPRPQAPDEAADVHLL